VSARGLFKRLLRAAGRCAPVRAAVLTALRKSVRAWPEGRTRQAIVGPVTTYLLPTDFRAVVTMTDGTRFYGSSLDIVTRMILYFGGSRGGCWEPRTARIASAIASRGGDIIVGGAHVGFFAISLARAAASVGGRVFAFEPAPPIFEELLRNVSLNEVPNLIAEQQALSDSSGSSTLYLQGVRSSLYQPTKGPADRREPVTLVAIDDYATQHGIAFLSLLLLDIEGAELAALRGAERLLRSQNAPDVLFEIIGGSSAGAQAAQYLDSLGFTVYYVDDDYELALREENAPLRVRPLADAPAGHRYFNALATRWPDRLASVDVTVEGRPSAA
jgi:FkbM family methyltransferase